MAYVEYTKGCGGKCRVEVEHIIAPVDGMVIHCGVIDISKDLPDLCGGNFFLCTPDIEEEEQLFFSCDGGKCVIYLKSKRYIRTDYRATKANWLILDYSKS